MMTRTRWWALPCALALLLGSRGGLLRAQDDPFSARPRAAAPVEAAPVPGKLVFGDCLVGVYCEEEQEANNKETAKPSGQFFCPFRELLGVLKGAGQAVAPKSSGCPLGFKCGDCCPLFGMAGCCSGCATAGQGTPPPCPTVTRIPPPQVPQFVPPSPAFSLPFCSTAVPPGQMGPSGQQAYGPGMIAAPMPPPVPFPGYMPMDVPGNMIFPRAPWRMEAKIQARIARQHQVKELMKLYHVCCHNGLYAEAEKVALTAKKMDPRNEAVKAAVHVAQVLRARHEKVEASPKSEAKNETTLTEEVFQSESFGHYCPEEKCPATEMLEEFGLSCLESMCPKAGTSEKMECRVHPLAGLDLTVDCSCSKEGAHQLIQMICQSIAPNTWKMMGGSGTIDYVPLAKALVICQTADIQEQVEDILAALRRLQQQLTQESSQTAPQHLTPEHAHGGITPD